MKRVVIGQFGSVTAISQDFGTDTVFVTFNEMGTVTNGASFWGDSFFEKKRVSCIGIMTNSPNWYPSADMARATSAVLRQIDGRRVITYGHSQGGYGALKFSNALTAAASIAFCPQYSIDPACVGHFDKRYAKYFSPAIRNGSPLSQEDLCSSAYVFYDPKERADATHVHYIGSIKSDIERVIVPFSGHASVRLITEAGLSGELVDQFLASDRPSAGALRNIIRRARPKSKIYAKQRLLHLHGAFPRTTASYIGFLPNAHPEVRPIFTAIYLAERKLFDEAESVISGIDDRRIKNFGLVELWTIFRRNGAVKAELRVAEVMQRLHRDDPFFQLHLVNSLIRANHKSDAAELLTAIVRTFGVDRYTHHIRQFAEALGMPGLAEDAVSFRRAS